MPSTSKQLFLRNYRLQQKLLMLFIHPWPDPRENKQILRVHTCPLLVYTEATLQDIHQLWPSQKNNFDSAAVIRQGHDTYLQLSFPYITVSTTLHFFHVSTWWYDFFYYLLLIMRFKDHGWTAGLNLDDHTLIDEKHWDRLIVNVAHSEKCFNVWIL